MMKTQTKTTSDNLIARPIIIDPSLDNYSEPNLFKEKVEAAKELLRICPIPKEFLA